ncbi:MAG: phenylacetate--CoA ligase family protein, partial [Candidatus Bathyarchaeota archaeon]
MRSQWKPYEELKKLQNRKLRALLKYAYQNIRFYHEKLEKAGVKPEEIKIVEDLTKIPYTTKSEVKANFPDKMVASSVDLNKCWKPQTTGSTGRPLTVVYNEEAEDFEKATILRPNLGCGQRLFDRWIVFTDPRRITKKKWFQNFGLFNPLRLSLFMEINKQVEMLQSVSPQIIYAYSSHLYALAKVAKKKDVKINPRLMFSTAELLDQKTRKYIEEVFGSKLYDQFGCAEFGRTAWECPKRCGYHMDMEAVVMEFIRD